MVDPDARSPQTSRSRAISRSACAGHAARRGRSSEGADDRQARRACCDSKGTRRSCHRSAPPGRGPPGRRCCRARRRRRPAADRRWPARRSAHGRRIRRHPRYSTRRRTRSSSGTSTTSTRWNPRPWRPRPAAERPRRTPRRRGAVDRSAVRLPTSGWMIEFSVSRSASVRNALAAKAGRLRLPSSVENLVAERVDQPGEAGRARFHDLARDRIGVDEIPQLGERPRHGGFACSHAPREADSQHRFSLASRHAGPDSGQIRQADDVVRYVRFGLVWARCRKRVSHGQQEKTRRSAPPRHARWGALHPHPGGGRGARDTPSQLVQRVAEPGAAQLRRDAPPHRRRYQDAVGAETGDNLRKRQKEWLGPLGPGHSSVLRSHHGYRFAAAAAGGVESRDSRRHDHLPRAARSRDRTAPEPGGFPLTLRPGHGVRDRPHHDGRQHRDLPRQPLPPLRRRPRPRRHRVAVGRRRADHAGAPPGRR